MDIGVFIPIANNGWIMSATSPQYMPTFELNKQVTLKAEKYGLDFALSMIKLHGFGGETEFWDYALESFTLMAGLAAVTSKIKLYASVPVLAIPAPIAARMAVTIDSISGGRFGINIVSGWQKAEYDQMDIWPGERHFLNRYDFCAEYVTVMKELWRDGESNFKGDFLTMKDCKLLPKPQVDIKIVCAGQSQTGVDFAANHADYNFCFGMGLNEPKKCAEAVARNVAAAKKAGSNTGALLLFMIIADETDEAAMAKWEHYKKGADLDAIAWMNHQGEADPRGALDVSAIYMSRPPSAMNLNIGTLVGSYETVAKLMDEIAEIEGASGVLLTFDDFLVGLDQFGQRIQPLMKTRRDVVSDVLPA
ncbi:MAG: pyrimidine utilization protein A [Caulobacter sp.]|nr:pyrimidine utilization protein A [Caulobacter sp.]